MSNSSKRSKRKENDNPNSCVRIKNNLFKHWWCHCSEVEF